jgi:hypothetical protein
MRERIRAARTKGFLDAKDEGDFEKIPIDDPAMLKEAWLDFKSHCKSAVKVDKNGLRRITPKSRVFLPMDMDSPAGKSWTKIPHPKNYCEEAYNDKLIYTPPTIMEGDTMNPIIAPNNYVPTERPQDGRPIDKAVLAGDLIIATLSLGFAQSKIYTGITVILTRKPIQFIARSTRPKGTQGLRPSKYARPYVAPSAEQLEEDNRMRANAAKGKAGGGAADIGQEPH